MDSSNSLWLLANFEQIKMILALLYFLAIMRVLKNQTGRRSPIHIKTKFGVSGVAVFSIVNILPFVEIDYS